MFVLGQVQVQVYFRLGHVSPRGMFSYKLCPEQSCSNGGVTCKIRETVSRVIPICPAVVPSRSRCISNKLSVIESIVFASLLVRMVVAVAIPLYIVHHAH